jgi:hypothetical protein
MRFTTSLAVAAILAAGSHTVAHASEIYRWVDEDGVVHYSDTKPAEAFATLQLEDTRPTDYDPAEDFYSIVNQARRLNETLVELATVRQEREERRRVEAQETAFTEPATYEPYRYAAYPFYYSPSVVNYSNHPIRRAQQQFRVLDELALTQPPAYSINSGVHRARVERSQALPAAILRSPSSR